MSTTLRTIVFIIAMLVAWAPSATAQTDACAALPQPNFTNPAGGFSGCTGNIITNSSFESFDYDWKPIFTMEQSLTIIEHKATKAYSGIGFLHAYALPVTAGACQTVNISDTALADASAFKDKTVTFTATVFATSSFALMNGIIAAGTDSNVAEYEQLLSNTNWQQLTTTWSVDGNSLLLDDHLLFCAYTELAQITATSSFGDALFDNASLDLCLN